MGTRNDLDGLIGFVGSDDLWRERLADVMDEHLLPAMEEFEVDFEELGDILGETWPMVLWGAAFEDFLGRFYEPDGQNFVDVYLKRKGGSETDSNRAYIEGLRDAPVSLYEVSKIEPGKSMLVRDLLTGSAPVMVREKSATRMLKPWDRIAVRVVPQGDHHVISGALLPFTPDASDLLAEVLRDALNLGKRKKLRLSADQLRQCAPLFSNAWLFESLPGALDPEPMQLANAEGDELLFHDLRFPFAKGVVQKDVMTRLAEMPAIQPAGPKAWNWLAPEDERNNRPTGGLVVAQMNSGNTVLGTLELKGKALILSVNSASRAERGEILIMESLKDLLKRPLSAIQTVDQVMANRDQIDNGSDEEEIPPDIARQIIHQQLDQHYRDTLNQPIPALGGKTPRQSVRSAAGRKKVVEWLKLIENRSANRAGTPLADYDFRWIWEELGLERERR
ncbi:hypothetical protein [Aliiruegeria lutimaris]|uniref:Antitoxin Xre/MbcA/ParS-like toxin-binding domain-containing protein n=1 Tax=Aliiruegeria lutimaris TaxID=571298 RepID=A0A1G9P981_9RHOB|nr:hypothetical protein [Aliiruegeria lutimaris]SDL95061.1 hypothetical protein SAMN04488026_11365 [Aliiruegeria lutimaris]